MKPMIQHRPHGRKASRRRRILLFAIGLVMTLMATACSAGAAPAAPITTAALPSTSAAMPSGIMPPTPSGNLDASPSAAAAGAATPTFVSAPDSARVDLVDPVFSDPTTINNPLFPRVGLTQTVQLGAEGSDKLRFEVTLLPDIKVIEWNGQPVETRVTHFVAYSNGRILEVAHDFYAQADDGSVWYFGEDVFNYEDGDVVDHEGTWLADKDGPPGMIMPADPQVGDVYRPENIPGVVFEEVTVLSTGETVDGPRGPVPGAVLVQEHLMDGTVEDKFFAPGYGEFHAEVVTLKERYGVALAVPIDALPGPVPDELTTLSTGATDMIDADPGKDGEVIAAAFDRMTSAWEAYRVGDLPERLALQMTDALDALTAAVGHGNGADTRHAAVDVARAALDFELRHRPIIDVDLARLRLWACQLGIDVAAQDPASVVGDVASIEAIWDRIDHAIEGGRGERIGHAVVDLRTAADADDLATVGQLIATFRDALPGMKPAQP